MKVIFSALSSAALVVATIIIGATPAQAADNSLETSDVVECGQITITLRNVSPWIYPVSVYIDGNPRTFGPAVDNRTGGGVTGPQKDQTGSKTYTFPEDSGTHTVRYVVEAGTEADLYTGQPAGQSTTRTVESDCFPPNSLETSDIVECGQITISLRNVSPWIYPVSVYIDDNDRVFGPVVDNRTGGGVTGPQKDQTGSKTYTFPEDSGTHTVRYVVEAGTEADLYTGQPAGQSTTRTVESDCVKEPSNSGGATGVGDSDGGDGADGADSDSAAGAGDDDQLLPDTGASESLMQVAGGSAAIALGIGLVMAARPQRVGNHLLTR